MAEARARNYIERLPEIIEREEEDVSHLDREMLEILYPARAPKEFTLTVVFGPPAVPEDADGETGEAARRGYERAVELARKGRDYRVEGSDRFERHRATYGIDEVAGLHDLFEIVGEYPSCEILVKGKRVPFARELWLPLFWFFRKDD